MKHRYAVLGAIAIGLLVCFLLMGRVRADGPPAGDRPATDLRIQVVAL